MLTIPANKVAVIPIYDPNMIGSIYVPPSFQIERKEPYYSIERREDGKVLEETDDYERALQFVRIQLSHGVICDVIKRTRKETSDIEVGDRCDQGVVKYIGKDVKTLQVGDYVIFSGYTGTLLTLEGEGKLIILPEKFVEAIYHIDSFIEINGLYMKSHSGYVPVTYDTAMQLIAETFTEKKLTLPIKSSKPKLEDYNVR